jgi:hypothetical protein
MVAAAAAVALLAFLAIVARAPALGPPGPDAVTFESDTTERWQSLRDGIPIKDSYFDAHTGGQTVVYSTKLDSAPANVRARIATSVAASYCIAPDILQGDNEGSVGSPCTDRYGGGTPNNPNDDRRPGYPIDLEVHIYKVSGGGFGAESDGHTWLAKSNPPWGPPCDENKHHCQVRATVDRTTTPIVNPNPGTDLYINVEIIAWSNSAARLPGDLLELGGECTPQTNYNNCDPVEANQPDPGHPNFLQDTTGHSNVLWLGSSYGTPPAPETVDKSSARIDDDTIPVGPGGVVVHHERVDNLEPGDVVEAEASGVDLQGHGFDHSADSWWVLAPNTTERGLPQSLPVGGSSRYMSGKNGINCLDLTNPAINGKFNGECSVGQNGAITVPLNAPSTMWLNYVVRAKDGSTAGATPHATVLDGHFDFKCDPQPRVPPDLPCSFAP